MIDYDGYECSDMSVSNPWSKEALVLDVHYPDGSTIEWTHNIHRFWNLKPSLLGGDNAFFFTHTRNGFVQKWGHIMAPNSKFKTAKHEVLNHWILILSGKTMNIIFTSI